MCRCRCRCICIYIHTCTYTYIYRMMHAYMRACAHHITLDTNIHAHVHTCMQASTHAHKHAHLHRCMQASTHARIHAHLHTCMHARKHTYIHARTHCTCIIIRMYTHASDTKMNKKTCNHERQTYIHTRKHRDKQTYTCTNIRTYKRTHVHAFTRAHNNAHKYGCEQETNNHACAHAPMRTRTHTHTHLSLWICCGDVTLSSFKFAFAVCSLGSWSASAVLTFLLLPLPLLLGMAAMIEVVRMSFSKTGRMKHVRLRKRTRIWKSISRPRPGDRAVAPSSRHSPVTSASAGTNITIATTEQQGN